MPGNSFGQFFRLTTFGESHGNSVGGVIDGCPAGLKVDMNFVETELARRNPVFPGTTARKEPDRVEWLSGLLDNVTLGTPIAYRVKNEDFRQADYKQLQEVYRPSHADYSYEQKYGIRDFRGGGRASGRETVARVIAGAVAKLFLKESGIMIQGAIHQIGELILQDYFADAEIPEMKHSSQPLLDPKDESAVLRLIRKAIETGDTLGGIIVCRIHRTPAGLGEPVFDKLQADLAKAMLSIGTARAFEFGLGFRASGMTGSAYNDQMAVEQGRVKFETNHDGGIQGGITNGEEVFFRVGFKPVPSIHQPQQMTGKNLQPAEITLAGRHDACHIPRLVVIVESMAALVLADHVLRKRNSRV